MLAFAARIGRDLPGKRLLRHAFPELGQPARSPPPHPAARSQRTGNEECPQEAVDKVQQRWMRCLSIVENLGFSTGRLRGKSAWKTFPQPARHKHQRLQHRRQQLWSARSGTRTTTPSRLAQSEREKQATHFEGSEPPSREPIQAGKPPSKTALVAVGVFCRGRAEITPLRPHPCQNRGPDSGCRNWAP